jgi:hypothetical protein
MSYQNFQAYNGSMYGSPQYRGIEFDWEVPDNMVVASPGGVSTTQHHYTKGVYGEGASHWDIYGGEGQRYPYAEHGGLYTVGHNAPQKQHEYAQTPPDMMYTQNQSSAHIDNFTPVKLGGDGKSPIEFISPPDSSATTPLTPLQPAASIKVPNPWFIFIVILFVYLALDFWTSAGESFIFTRFHDGKTPNWKWLAFYGVVFTLIVFLLTSTIGIPLVTLEMGQI